MTASASILIVEDDPTTLEYLKSAVEGSGRAVRATLSGREGLEMAKSGSARVLLLDWLLPDLCGLEITRSLRRDPDLDYYFIIMLSTRCDRESVLHAFDVGVDDFLRKPTDPAEVLARLRTAERIVSLQQTLIDRTQMLDRMNTTLLSLNEKLTRVDNQDDLTGLLSRREVLDRLEFIWDHAAGEVGNIACAMIDVDHFKQLNDTYGHAAGDQALRQLARNLRQSARSSDVIGRIGGDEFIIAFPGLDARAAAAMLTPLVRQAEEILTPSDLPGRDPGFRLNLSIGIAQRTEHTKRPSQLVELADAALYKAKAAGRGRIEIDINSLSQPSPSSRADGDTGQPRGGADRRSGQDRRAA